MNIGDWPDDLIPYEWDFYLQPNSRPFNSPITRSRQVIVGQGARWVGTGSFRFNTRRKEQRFEALLDSLEGQANTVNIWDFAQKFGLQLGLREDMSSITGVTYLTTPGSPGGVVGFISGSPSVITGFSGGSAGIEVYGTGAVGATEIVIRWFPQGTTPIYAGDQIELGGFLYRVTNEPEADGLNRVTLTLNRPLVAEVLHGEVPVFVRPRTPMQLLDDDQTRRSVDVDHLRQYTVSFIEALF